MISNPSTARRNIETNDLKSEHDSRIVESFKHNSSIWRNFVSDQGKRVRFYRNGDQFFKGLWYTITAFRSWYSLLEDLNQHLGDSISLPHGVRYIFTVDGMPKNTLEELKHGKSYVCSSTEKFKTIDYANASQPMWSFVSSQKITPSFPCLYFRCEKEPNEFVKPRIITIIRNGLKPRRVVRHLLNKRTAQSFEHVMQDITAIVKLNSGLVKKLYAISGKQISCLADFFGDDYVFVAYGPEKVYIDDFKVIFEEYKRMNLRGEAAQCKLGQSNKRKIPERNDGFRKIMSPDLKSNINQIMKLPSKLSDRIKIVELLGDGNTALVFKALFKIEENFKENEDFNSKNSSADALKIIPSYYAEGKLDFIETEIQLLSEIRHEYIIAMKEYQVVDNSWYIRLELMNDGDLLEYLRMRRTLNEIESASCISCLCQALNYLHKRNIVHRDVKPENLLICHCLQTGLLKLKLADFGMACKLRDDELLHRLCGTPTYVAPEVLAEFGYSYKADCWSVGIVLYVLLCGFPPFGIDEDLILFNKIIQGVFGFPSPSFDNVSYAARLLIRKLLSTDPNLRYSAEEVLKYFWIQELGNSNELKEQLSKQELELAMASFKECTNQDNHANYFFSRQASVDELNNSATTENSMTRHGSGSTLSEPGQI